MLKILISAIMLVSSSVALAQLPARLVVLGDSISAGYGVELNRDWVVLLQKKIDAGGLNIHVINASISGDTSSGGLARVDAVLKQTRPQWLVLELGANDGLRGLPPQQMKLNLKAIIQRSQQAGARVILLGMKIPPNYSKRYTEAFHNVYQQLATELKLTWVAFLLEKVALKPELMQKDGLHPNTLAQPLIAETVWTILKPLISINTHH
jgi:acyl-CoA thioesterase-1